MKQKRAYDIVAGMIEIRMHWKTALALGAVLPRHVEEHRKMLAGPFIRVRCGESGLVFFWAIDPELIQRSSQ